MFNWSEVHFFGSSYEIHTLSKRQIMWEIVSNFVAFLENLNFNKHSPTNLQAIFFKISQLNQNGTSDCSYIYVFLTLNNYSDLAKYQNRYSSKEYTTDQADILVKGQLDHSYNF